MGNMFDEPPVLQEAINTIAAYVVKQDFTDTVKYKQLRLAIRYWTVALDSYETELSNKPSPNQLTLLTDDEES